MSINNESMARLEANLIDGYLLIKCDTMKIQSEKN